MLSISEHQGLFLLYWSFQTEKHYWLCSGGSTKPTLSYTWDEVPQVEFSLFIFLILISYQPNTGMLWKVHNRPSGVCVCEEATLKATPETLSYPRQLLLNLHPWFPHRESRQGKGDFSFTCMASAEGVRLIAAPFLSTWTRTKVGSLRLSMILACGLLHQLVSALGGSESGGREDAAALTDIQYTQLMPRTGKFNNIISTAGS